ncbi:helix-turn-helix domain-containing protein [Levilactobacillus brevis]|nr:helix-turn-helix transcriptional regulator [Levilactobacillus brevis]
MTNVSRQAISKWEVGSTYPDIDRLVQISNLFDITLDSLIKGDDSLKKA